MDKAVKISIVAGALLVALSVAYYLVIFLPKEAMRLEQRKQEQEVNMLKEQQTKKEDNQKTEEARKVALNSVKERCSMKAKDFYDNWVPRETSEEYSYGFVSYYNSNLDKCFIHITGIFPNRKIENHFVYEVYENKQMGILDFNYKSGIIELCTTLDGECKTKEEFYNYINPLMTENQ